MSGRASMNQIEWDANCAEILEHLEDFFEAQEPDYDPTVKWAGENWRVGRSGMHRARIQDKTTAALPGWVSARANRHYRRLEGEAS